MRSQYRKSALRNKERKRGSRDMVFSFCLVPGTMPFKFDFGRKEADPPADADLDKTNDERKCAEGKEHFMDETHLVCIPLDVHVFQLCINKYLARFIRSTLERMRCCWRTPSSV